MVTPAAAESVVLPRDCLTSFQVRMLFGRRNEEGKVVPISRVTLKRWRQKGVVDFIAFNCRTYYYPKESVQRVLRQSNYGIAAA